MRCGPYDSWNGLSLNTPYWDTVTWGGTRMALPTLRGQDIEVAYRAGKQMRPKFPDSRTITFIMWTAGIDQATGKPAADQRLAWNNNWQQLRDAFWTRGPLGSAQGTLSRLWYYTQGGVAQLVSASALGEIAGSMEPTMTGRNRADFSVDILLADPYFYGAPVATTLTLNVAKNVTNFGEGQAGEGQPSTVNTFSLVLNGPLTVPTLTNTTAGVSLTYGATIQAGVSLTIDLLRFQASDSVGVNQVPYVGHAGSRFWFLLLSGLNSLTLTSLSGADSGNAILTFCPPYV